MGSRAWLVVLALATGGTACGTHGTDAADDDGGGGSTHTISGTVMGLTSSGLILRDNGADDLELPAGASTFTFAARVADGLIGNVVHAGDPAGSPLYKRMSYAAVDTPADKGQMMPPLAKNHVDRQALGIVEQWILSLP